MSDFKPYPMKLAPVFSPRPWGGERLRTVLKKDIPAGEKIGESWELSDHPDGRSRIANGPYAGEFFGDLVRAHPKEMCGVDRAPDRFPLLVKYIDAGEDLSLQVHPGDEEAKKYGDRGKAECWYIIDCAPGAEIIHGLREDVTPDRLRAAIASSDPIEKKNAHIRSLTRSVPIHPGTFVNVPPGTVHAILGGTLLCEIQQSSNLTFRLWDWGRQPERPLHVDKALSVSQFGKQDLEPCLQVAPNEAVRSLLKNRYFEVEWVSLRPRMAELTKRSAAQFEFARENSHGKIFTAVRGKAGPLEVVSLQDTTPISIYPGDTWFFPPKRTGFHLSLSTDEDFEIMVSTPLDF